VIWFGGRRLATAGLQIGCTGSLAGMVQAIASSAPRANVEAILEALAAADIFQTIVSGRCASGKPDPEVYLTRLRGRRIARQVHCCGGRRIRIEGARNAGMKSIGVSRSTSLPMWSFNP